MRTDASGNVVALYWDFENIHASLFDLEWAGSRTYNQPGSRNQPSNRFTPQDVLVNIKAVVDYARSIGDLAINRAYNNWQWFSRYRDELNRAGIDLVQIYPKGNFAKNGADIRLALDVLEDIYRYPKLTHVVIVSSDSDFISLAQKLKQLGRTVIGVGVEQATNTYWAQCCDEFRYYDTLLGLMVGGETKAAAAVDPTAAARAEAEPTARPLTLEDARALLIDAVRRLIAQRNAEQVPKTALKVLMKRLDPTFDEANFGFLSFTSFLHSFPDAVEVLEGSHPGGEVRLVGVGAKAGRSASGEGEREEAAAEPAPQEVVRQDYELILKRGNLRPLPVCWWRAALPLMEEIFREAPGGKLDSFDYLEGELCARLGAAGFADDQHLVHKLRGNLFSLWLFKLDKENQTIGLNLSAGDSLLRRVEKEMVRRIVRFAAPPVNAEHVAAILYAEDAPARLEEARELIALLTQQRQPQQQHPQEQQQGRQQHSSSSQRQEQQLAALESAAEPDAAGVVVAETPGVVPSYVEAEAASPQAIKAAN